jgi:DNA polymerase-3 subunit alpha/error-prone DNA polymerase
MPPNAKSAFRGTVVIGFMAIKGLSVAGAEAIIAERERSGDFSSLDNFSRRVKLNRDDIIALCPAGVFDSIAEGLSRPLQARRLLEMKNVKCGMTNGELFDSEIMPTYTANANKIAKEKKTIKTANNLWEEYGALGFLRNNHPLVLWKNEVLAVKYRVKAVHIGKYVGRSVKMVGWPVTQKDVWTKDGLTMSFLSLEDETALYETVIFPQVYDRYSRLLFDQQPLLIYGSVAVDEGALSVEINRIEVLV